MYKENPHLIASYRNNIKTFSEGVLDPAIHDAKFHMMHANRIIFLGFGFHHLNLRLFKLTPEQIENSKYERLVISTGVGISEPNKREIVKRLNSSIGKFMSGPSDIDLSARCTDLFDKSSLSLGFEPEF